MTTEFDLKSTLTGRRITGLWRMLEGVRIIYIGAFVCIGLAAVAQTGFSYLLRYFTDNVLGNPARAVMLPIVAAGFIVLALMQGGFTFTAGRWAAKASETTTRRLRDYLYDQIQRSYFAYHDKTPTGELIQRATSDVDALRRFFGEESVGFGRIVMLFIVNFISAADAECAAGPDLGRRCAACRLDLDLLLQEDWRTVRDLSGAGSQALDDACRKTCPVYVSCGLLRARITNATSSSSIIAGATSAAGKLLMLHAIYWPTTDIIVGVQL